MMSEPIGSLRIDIVTMADRLEKKRRTCFSIIRHASFNTHKKENGFTLLEVLIAIFIFAVIVTTVFASYHSMFIGSESIDQNMASYDMAKNCLNRMIFDLESIHVSLYPKYAPPDLDDPPDPYRVVGETIYIKTTEFPKLRFTSFSHLSLDGKPIAVSRKSSTMFRTPRTMGSS